MKWHFGEFWEQRYTWQSLGKDFRKAILGLLGGSSVSIHYSLPWLGKKTVALCSVSICCGLT